MQECDQGLLPDLPGSDHQPEGAFRDVAPQPSNPTGVHGCQGQLDHGSQARAPGPRAHYCKLKFHASAAGDCSSVFVTAVRLCACVGCEWRAACIICQVPGCCRPPCDAFGCMQHAVCIAALPPSQCKAGCCVAGVGANEPGKLYRPHRPAPALRAHSQH